MKNLKNLSTEEVKNIGINSTDDDTLAAVSDELAQRMDYKEWDEYCEAHICSISIFDKK